MIFRDPREAARKKYDVIIVGGGIYGAMLSLEAARRGSRALLVEKNDFGGATSFNSLRIIHGGLRYLQTLDLPRFNESVQERRWFLQQFPDLVRALPCLMPLYGNGLHRPAVLRLALGANELLSWRRNKGVRAERWLPAGAVISARETQELFPLVDTKGLKGGAVWYDACMPDSPRVVMEVLRWACARSATTLNYVEATTLLAGSQGVTGIGARDQETGETFEYQAPLVVNATGPWSRLTARAFDRDEESLFRSSIAWNILFDRAALSDHALAVAPKKSRAKAYFLHPWKGKLLVGTGHAPWKGELDQPQPSEEQLAAFVADINAAIPKLELRVDEITRIFAGLLPAKDVAGTTIADREVIVDHGERNGPKGLYSLSGVKFTTSRRVAEKVMRLLQTKGGCGGAGGAARDEGRPAAQSGWQLSAPRMLEDDRQDWRKDLAGIIAEESVMHLDDLVLRRTTLWESPEQTLQLARQLCAGFNWDAARCTDEIMRLEASLGKRNPDFNKSETIPGAKRSFSEQNDYSSRGSTLQAQNEKR